MSGPDPVHDPDETEAPASEDTAATPGVRESAVPDDLARRDDLHAVFDPFSGIAGDMVLGCWIDLGLDREWLLEVAAQLSVRVADIRVERVRRAGLVAHKVTIEPPGDGKGGRHFSEIRDLVETSDMEERAKAVALGAFGRLAAAEGRVHGIPPERVHFHEVGALDAILDICGAADGLVRLGIREATTLPVALGQGNVQISHGTYPVPAPATAYLLEGTTVRAAGYPYESVTPTGAALLAEFCRGRAPAGDATVVRVGYGAGSLDPEDHPNCLRVWLVVRPGDPARTVVVLQTDVDDMAPEYIPRLVDACLEAGALDAVVHPVHMKKGRPGWRLDVQVEAARRAEVERAIFGHSSTLGVRRWTVERHVLERRVERRTWRGHTIRVKLRRDLGSPAWTVGKAEHEDVVAAAAAEGMEPLEVLRLLRREWPDLR